MEKESNSCARNGIAINRLSTICGLAQSTLNNIVNGRYNNSTGATVQKICDGLGIGILDFFSGGLFAEIMQEIR